MWMLFVRAPSPDAPYWEGRRWLAAVDALAWPALWALLALNLPMPGGIVSAAGVALAGVAAWSRLRVALWNNHRYRFTTWRWAQVLATLLLFGAFLKWAATL